MQTLLFEIISLIFQTAFLLRSLHYPVSLCTSCAPHQNAFSSAFSPAPKAHSLGVFASPQQPLLYALSISTPIAPSAPFSFSSFVEACIYFQRLLYSAFYVPCFKSFYSPEHSQLSILSQRGRWIFLEVIIQGKKTRPHYLIHFTIHLNEWYVGTTSKCLLKWLI